MNLLFRMLYVLYKAWQKPTIETSNLTNTVSLLTFPTDLDINFHVNNGRYLTLCDLSRLDLFLRTGLLRLMIKNKWSPIIAEHTMTYLKPLPALAQIKITMDISSWDHRYFFCGHQFYWKGTLVAEGTSKALIIDKNGALSPENVVKSVEAWQKGRSNTIKNFTT